MTSFFQWFHGAATWGGLFDFIVGFVAAILLNFWWCRRKNKPININWRYVGIVLGLAMMVFISLQTQVAYNLAKETATEVRDCQKQFNSALQARAQITTENDEISQNQRKIIFDWIHDLIRPPEPYFSMDPNDPRRQQWGIDRTINTEHNFQQSLNRQEELQSQREQHALPDPTCGK